MKDYEDEAFDDIERAQGWRKRQILSKDKDITQLEAMKLALEALELFCECGTMDRPIERREALRQAIEQAKNKPDFEKAYLVWQDKTEWVQETVQPHELGMHRADVLRQRIEQAQKQDDHLKWKLRGYKTLDPMKNERIAESFGWGKGASYDDCLQCSVFKLDEFSNAIRMDERDIILQGVETPEPDKSSLFTFGALESYAATCVTKALQKYEQAQKQEPVAWYPKVERIFVDGKLMSQTIQYNPQGEKLPYPTPPQRQWVGLTDEEKQHCIYDEQGFVLDYEDCVDKTEAKLKEKNT